MILCHSEIEAWCVKYTYREMPAKMITLEKVKADAYAAQFRGEIIPLYCPVAIQPEKKELVPWEGETTLKDVS